MASYLTKNEPMRTVMARISRQGVLHQKNFPLTQYKTWEKAERAGKKWVKETLPTLPQADSTRGKLTARNSSGVVGVRLANATRTRNERVYPDWRWVAYWAGCEQSGGIGFSVKSYGDREAFLSACLARELESLDRDAIAAELKRRKGSPELRAMVRAKKQSAPV
jgi:AP2 domain